MGFSSDSWLVRRTWKQGRVFFLLEDGDVASVARAWTDLAEPDVFVTVTAGRSPFRVEDALALAEPVGRARPESRAGHRWRCVAWLWPRTARRLS
ncbi:MAG: DUF5372 family protein [Actinomycetota bacterium]